MTESDPLARLETLVHTLVERFKRQRARGNELEQQLSEAHKRLERLTSMEATVREQEAEIARLRGNRDEARRRVEALLEQVSELEM
jgi:predicted RNase H-like nuclease (RuvC/YqgF family)